MTTGQEIGNAFALAKIDLLTNGISNKLANQYIGNKYMEDSISTTYSSIQQTIREGSPIYSMMDTGTFDNTGTPIAHAVLFTGVTSDGKARYWDPQTDTYESTNDFSKFSGTTKIYIDGEIRVACR
ncbi:hypothetical protein D3C80_1331500 [compost metagenome]